MSEGERERQAKETEVEKAREMDRRAMDADEELWIVGAGKDSWFVQSNRKVVGCVCVGD